jgi:gentisate 1,2-dioxygenase
MRPHLLRAGEIISAAEAVRRVLILENPGMPGSSAVTSTLYAGLQLILPGEIAPAHRHTQSAFRFVLEGEGAFTTVRGERFAMSPGDLILTPSLEWHDHGHEGRDPVIWLDGLDIPLVRSLDAGFAENGDRAQQALRTATGTNEALWGSGLRLPRDALPGGCAAVERFIYPCRDWVAALKKMAALGSPDPHCGYCLEFSNPVDGGTVLPTMSAFCHLIPSGFTARPQRSSASNVFCVYEGEGEVTVGPDRFQLSPHDIWVVPSWQSFSVKAHSTLVLFSYSDRAAQERLGLWREEKSQAGRRRL